ncbi:MAG: hypothetical protein OJF50_001716 [Nitrospira sp.]|nr:hypothetical protein [Nitrospira sp.]
MVGFLVAIDASLVKAADVPTSTPSLAVPISTEGVNGILK